MKDQLLAIAILLGTAFGLFWFRHLMLTVANRHAQAVPLNAADDSRGDGFVDSEPTPIAWLTTADPEPEMGDEFMEPAPASRQHLAKPYADIPLIRPWPF
jgi:hypothetical protein